MISQEISVNGAKIHYLEVGNPQLDSILLLHGASFQAQTWQEIGVLEALLKAGYSAIAIDLPGYGQSQSLLGFEATFLTTFIDSLNLKYPIIVSPSMSGRYSFPLVTQYADKLGAFVAVAPVGIKEFKEQLMGIKLPTLAIWGSNDRTVPVSLAEELITFLPNAQKVILKNAGHACYMRATTEFIEHLLEFVEKIPKEM
ncbi:MAG: alpha/beta hydrolase [Cyanobacteria bacterium P01_G01_bin.49]